MKKLILSVAIVCATVAAQAASIKWTSSANVPGIDAAGVTDNGIYSGSGDFKGTGNVLNYVLTVYASGSSDVVATFSGKDPYGTGSKKISKSLTDDAIKQGTAYDYEIVLTGVNGALQARGKDGDYDYSAATLSATIKGSITTEPSGVTTFVASPSSWTVSGITKAEPTPEPTSGLLLILGIAGLALKRKNA